MNIQYTSVMLKYWLDHIVGFNLVLIDAAQHMFVDFAFSRVK